MFALFGIGIFELLLILLVLAMGVGSIVVALVVAGVIGKSKQKQNLIQCPDCQRMISPSAKVCPHCGRPAEATP